MMEQIRTFARRRPILFGWACYVAAWLAMAFVAFPVASVLANLASTDAAGLVYFACSFAIGISLLFVRRHIRDGLPGIEIESDLAPAIRLVVWSIAWPFVTPFSLLGAGLRAARL